jgi:hypothetical protein
MFGFFPHEPAMRCIPCQFFRGLVKIENHSIFTGEIQHGTRELAVAFLAET